MKDPFVLNAAAAQISCNGSPAKPISVGTGLLALDWLLIGKDRIRPNETYAGGSCGNVMAILAYLGWESFPIARLGKDYRAQQLMADLRECDVRTDFVLREERGVTPLIIIRLNERADGTSVSKFEWRHPKSGDWLPRYRPVPKATVQALVGHLPEANVFYFDRAEPSSLTLAKVMRERGAVVFFEPSSATNPHLFSQCLAVSDIVKYSVERFPSPPVNPSCNSPKLEIQTLGSEGLRFRVKMNSIFPVPWRNLPAFSVRDVRDTTGCGDWCSAGLISRLCLGGAKRFQEAEENKFVEALRFGQALAAVKCEYVGARGPMYHLDCAEVLAAASHFLSASAPQPEKAMHFKVFPQSKATC